MRRAARTIVLRFGVTLLAAALVSLYTQGSFRAESIIGMVAFLGVAGSLCVAFVMTATLQWRMVLPCLLVASYCATLVFGMFTCGHAVFYANRLAVQRSTAALSLRIEEYRRSHGAYPEDWTDLSLEEPSFGSAVIKYSRQEDDSFAFVIWDPGDAGRSYFWSSRTKVWREHYEPGWIF